MAIDRVACALVVLAATVPLVSAAVETESLTGESCQGLGARYSVTFSSFWKEPGDVAPFGAEHFSPVVSWAHDGSPLGMVWSGEAMATEGLEEMAETGMTGILEDELAELAVSGHVANQQVSRFDSQLFTPFSETWTMTVDEAHPYISIVSMVAPSPDWFIGAHMNMMKDDGSWILTEIINLDDGYVWDAGTEKGRDFALDNAAQNPHMPISDLVRELSGGTGTLGFELVECIT